MWDEFAEIIRLSTGLELNQSELESMASRVTDNTRRFNIQEGLTSADDRLPDRLVKESLEEGRSVNAGELDILVKDYYRMRGWNEAGVPPEPTS